MATILDFVNEFGGSALPNDIGLEYTTMDVWEDGTVTMELVDWLGWGEASGIVPAIDRENPDSTWVIDYARPIVERTFADKLSLPKYVKFLGIFNSFWDDELGERIEIAFKIPGETDKDKALDFAAMIESAWTNLSDPGTFGWPSLFHLIADEVEKDNNN